MTFSCQGHPEGLQDEQRKAQRAQETLRVPPKWNPHESSHDPSWLWKLVIAQPHSSRIARHTLDFVFIPGRYSRWSPQRRGWEDSGKLFRAGGFWDMHGQNYWWGGAAWIPALRILDCRFRYILTKCHDDISSRQIMRHMMMRCSDGIS